MAVAGRSQPHSVIDTPSTENQVLQRSQWHWRRIGVFAVSFGLAYTVFSEWFNTSVRMSWSYSEWMPLTPLVPLGVSPLLQWLLLPAIALVLARRSRHKAS